MREERIARAGKRYRIELICDGVPGEQRVEPAVGFLAGGRETHRMGVGWERRCY